MKLSSMQGLEEGSIVRNLAGFARDYFYNSNSWPQDQTTITLSLRQSSPS